MPLSITQHFRAVLRAAIPAAAFLLGWSLRPSAPATPAGQIQVSAAVKSRGAAAEKMAGAPGKREAAGAPAAVVRRGTAGSIAALLDKAATLDGPGTLAALKALDLLPRADRGLARQIFLARFSELDPQTALTYIDTLPSAERAASAATVMSTWAAQDPQSAAAYFEQTQEGFGLDEETAPEAVRAVTAAWAEKDSAAAAAWMQQLDDPSLRTTAAAALAATMASQNPSAAAALVPSLNEADQSAAAGAAATQWAQTQPQQAAAWARSLTGDAAASAAEGVVSAWMLSDPAAASGWVRELPAGNVRDAAITALTDSPAIRNDAASAASWAGVIQDSALRESALAAAMKRWRYQQPEAFADR